MGECGEGARVSCTGSIDFVGVAVFRLRLPRGLRCSRGILVINSPIRLHILGCLIAEAALEAITRCSLAGVAAPELTLDERSVTKFFRLHAISFLCLDVAHLRK